MIPTCNKVPPLGLAMYRSSPQRLEKFKEHCDNKKLVLILDVKTRWNSTYHMIERAILLRNAYVGICNVDDDLSDFSLQESDWKYLEQVCALLKRFDTMTTKISGSQYATIPLTIAVYNSLLDKIEDFIDTNDRLYPEICDAARLGKEKLKQYYAATDNSPIYAVATAMHPSMRFHWWSHRSWESEWQDLAKSTVRNVWLKQYEGKYDEPTQVLPVGDVNNNNDDDGEDDDDLFGAPALPKGSELEEYVAGNHATGKRDPLEFWQKNKDNWPNLAKMARDYLAIPATSTPSERRFSQARVILPYTRNRMDKKKIRESVLMDAWYKFFKDTNKY